MIIVSYYIYCDVEQTLFTRLILYAGNQKRKQNNV